MSDVVVIKAYYGNEVKTVKVVQPHLSGDNYHIYVDNWYHGIIMRRDNEWVVYLNGKSELSSNDILILSEMLDRYNDRTAHKTQSV